MNRSFFLFVGVVFLWKLSNAQVENFNWAFGDSIVISFAEGGGAEVVPTKSKVDVTSIGVASMSDQEGNLLFYTNGETVWNRDHDTMVNGYDLDGNKSSSQGVVIMPYPNVSDQYIIYTADHAGGSNGLKEHLVDMSRNEGRGEVTLKNHTLLDRCLEGLTAIRHCNGIDHWLIAHEYGLDSRFAVFKVTDQGVVDTTFYDEGYQQFPNPGWAKSHYVANTSGNKLASLYEELGIIEFFSFNNYSGTIEKDFSMKKFNCKGVAFSPDYSKLYVVHAPILSNTKLYQYDLKESEIFGDQYDSAKVVNSELVLGEYASGGGSIIMGPDQKLYVARYRREYIGIIDNPNELGELSNFNPDAISLSGRLSGLNIGNFSVAYSRYKTFVGQKDFTGCPLGNDSVKLVCRGGHSYSWSPILGLSDTTSSSPMAKISDTIEYRVLINNEPECEVDEYSFNIRPFGDYQNPQVVKGDDTICIQDSTLLKVESGHSYLWFPTNGLSDTDKGSVIANPDTTTIYNVTISDSNDCYSQQLSITVSVKDSTEIIPDMAVINKCSGDTVELMVTGGENYTWEPSIGLSSDTSSRVDCFAEMPTEYTISSEEKCTKESSITVNILPIDSCATPTSILDGKDGYGITLYPNPARANSEITIELNFTSRGNMRGVIELFDIQGYTHRYISINKKDKEVVISLKDLSPSLYMLKYTLGKEVVCRSILLQ